MIFEYKNIKMKNRKVTFVEMLKMRNEQVLLKRKIKFKKAESK